MKCSLGISNFLEEISSLSHSVVFLCFFALIAEEGFLISPYYYLELWIQMGISFLFSFAFRFSSFHSYLYGLLRQPFCFFAFLFHRDGPVPSVQFSSVAQLCPTLCEPKNHSMPCLPVHQLLKFTQTHVHQVGDAIQPSHPLSSPSPPRNPSQHQGLFQWVNSSHQVAKVLDFQLQHQFFQWTPRTELL